MAVQTVKDVKVEMATVRNTPGQVDDIARRAQQKATDAKAVAGDIAQKIEASQKESNASGAQGGVPAGRPVGGNTPSSSSPSSSGGNADAAHEMKLATDVMIEASGIGALRAASSMIDSVIDRMDPAAGFSTREASKATGGLIGSTPRTFNTFFPKGGIPLSERVVLIGSALSGQKEADISAWQGTSFASPSVQQVKMAMTPPTNQYEQAMAMAHHMQNTADLALGSTRAVRPELQRVQHTAMLMGAPSMDMNSGPAFTMMRNEVEQQG